MVQNDVYEGFHVVLDCMQFVSLAEEVAGHKLPSTGSFMASGPVVNDVLLVSRKIPIVEDTATGVCDENVVRTDVSMDYSA